MEQIATSPLLTPTTALFNSFLDFSSNDSPDAWSGGDGSVFSHTGEQHSNARQKQSRSNSADEPDASVQANDDCFGEDYFLTDLKDLDSGGLGSPGLHMRLSLGPPEERQKFPFSSSLLSPNSMAIIERNKMEHWEISQEMERQYRNGRSDSDPLSPMDDYSSYLADVEAEAPFEARIILNTGGKQARQVKKKSNDEKARSEKRTLVLERNRIAAGKCRRRKKATISTLEERCHMLKARNTAMRELACELMSEVESLKLATQFHEAGKCALNESDVVLEDVDAVESRHEEMEEEVDDKLLTVMELDI